MPNKSRTLGSDAIDRYGAGNITSMGQDVYHYDFAGRLTDGTADHGRVAQTYEYDPFGNVTKICTTPDLAVPRGIECEASISVDPATNRLNTAGTTYDTAGNLTFLGTTHHYTYDPLGMMTSQTAPGHVLQYIYTANDERIGMLSGSMREATSDATGSAASWNGYATTSTAATSWSPPWTWTIRDANHQLLKKRSGSNE